LTPQQSTIACRFDPVDRVNGPLTLEAQLPDRSTSAVRAAPRARWPWLSRGRFASPHVRLSGASRRGCAASSRPRRRRGPEGRPHRPYPQASHRAPAEADGSRRHWEGRAPHPGAGPVRRAGGGRVRWRRRGPRLVGDAAREQRPRTSDRGAARADLARMPRLRPRVARTGPRRIVTAAVHAGSSGPPRPVRPNTVKLGRDGGVAGLLLGLWPPGVVGAFDVPLGHLAFDDAWRRPPSSCRVEAGDQSAQEGQPESTTCVVVVRGEKRPGAPRTGG